MQLWKLILSYDGTHFHGWQVQPSLATIQGTLAAAIHQITGERVLPQGSGRTDAGVHALGQVATFSLEAPIPPSNLLRALNRALPSAIRVLSVEIAHENFHARHSAIRKTYEYRIFPRVPRRRTQPDLICSPMLAPYVWDCPWHFDLELAQMAAEQVVGEHDFTSFAAVDPDLTTRLANEPDSAVRTIHHSRWVFESGLYIYRVTGSHGAESRRNICRCGVETHPARHCDADSGRPRPRRSRSDCASSRPVSRLCRVPASGF